MQDTANDEFIRSLGTIYGVSEIRNKAKEDLSCTPVLVAENAFVFFAWDETEAANATQH